MRSPRSSRPPSGAGRRAGGRHGAKARPTWLAGALVGVFVLSTLLMVAGAQVAEPRFVARAVDLDIETHDGVILSARLHHRSWVGNDGATEAARERPVPIIVATHGWAEDKDILDGPARRIVNGLGFHVLAYDSRGFGDSGGVVGLNGPDEQEDVSSIIDWVVATEGTSGWPDDASRVEMERPSDPTLGMIGHSYAGAIQLMAAARDARIDVMVPEITWHDLPHALAPGDVVKRHWVDLLFTGGLLTSHSGGDDGPGDARESGGLDPRLATWWTEIQATGRLPAEAVSVLEQRSPRWVGFEHDADVLLIQGWRDTLFDPGEAVSSLVRLQHRDAGAAHALFHGGGHGHALPAHERDVVDAAIEAFLAASLDNGSTADIAPARFWDTGAARFVAADAFPPSSSETTLLRFTGASVLADGREIDDASVELHQASAPTSHTEIPQGGGDTLGPTDAPVPTSVRAATVAVGPDSFVGTPVLVWNVTPSMADATLFVSLVTVGPDGSHAAASDQVTALRVSDRSGTTVSLQTGLVPTQLALPAGHRLEVRIATSDTSYHGGRTAGTVLIDVPTAYLTWARLDADAADWAPPEPADEATESSPTGHVLAHVALVAALAAIANRRLAKGR